MAMYLNYIFVKKFLFLEFKGNNLLLLKYFTNFYEFYNKDKIFVN